MKKYRKIFVALAVVFVAAAIMIAAQQKGDETVTDPICRMAVKMADAKITADYQGKTYYFCCQSCKDMFLKDPAKYAADNAAEAPTGTEENPAMKGEMKKPCGMMHDCPVMRHHMAMMHSGPMCGHMMAGSGCAEKQKMAFCCPKHAAMLANVAMTVENTENGVIVKITSKDPEAVKMIQERWAQKKEAGKPSECTKSTKPETKK